MKLTNLFEGLSPVLYHATHAAAAVSILKKDQFFLSASYAKGAEDDISHDTKLFYMSTARTRTGGYHARDSSLILFELDGRKLSARFYGRAVDYWGPDFRSHDPTRFEQEDRIYHTDPVIKNASRYITAVHMTMRDGKVNSHQRQVYVTATKSRIPVYVYASASDLIAGRNALSTPEVHQLLKGVPTVHKSGSVRRRSKYIDHIKVVYNMIRYEPDTLPRHLHDDVGDAMRKALWGDWLSSVSADFHNANSSRNDDQQTQEMHREISRFMRRNRVRNLKDLLPILEDKWAEWWKNK